MMKFQLLHQSPRFCPGKSFIERRQDMRVQRVQPHSDTCGGGVVLVHQLLHLVRKILHGPPRGHHDVPPARLRLATHKEVACSHPLVCRVLPLELSHVGRQWGWTSASSCRLVSSQWTCGSSGSYGAVYTAKTSSIAATNAALTCGIFHCGFSHGLSTFFSGPSGWYRRSKPLPRRALPPCPRGVGASSVGGRPERGCTGAL
jgi:hypothetical protein